MIVRSIIAVDMAKIALSGLSTNLNELPSQIIGDTVTLGAWQATITTATDMVDIGDLTYPVKIHHEFDQSTQVTAIRVFRDVDGVELFFNFTPVASQGMIFDMRIEFYED